MRRWPQEVLKHLEVVYIFISKPAESQTLFTLYFDESGSRVPSRSPDLSRRGQDWFALGGYLIRQEDEKTAKALHSSFLQGWRITHPLHMTDMLARKKKFSWLGRLEEDERKRFWTEYKTFLASVPAIGLACVIDRPGYVARGYLDMHPESKWLLCRSAFDILLERSVKIAKLHERKLAVVFESDPPNNERTKHYFINLKLNGLAFNESNSAKYQPLSKAAFQETLSTIEYKDKSSTLLQIADSYVYAIAKNAYHQQQEIYCALRDSRRIANFALPPEHAKTMGVKHYCFDTP